jgi:hypothetical protein
VSRAAGQVDAGLRCALSGMGYVSRAPVNILTPASQGHLNFIVCRITPSIWLASMS